MTLKTPGEESNMCKLGNAIRERFVVYFLMYYLVKDISEKTLKMIRFAFQYALLVIDYMDWYWHD